MDQKYCLVYSTCPKDHNISEIISEILIKEKLAACVNVINNITSRYIWNNNLEVCNENLLIIKTKLCLFEKVKSKIIELHNYQTPEVIAIPIVKGCPDYLSWIDNRLIDN